MRKRNSELSSRHGTDKGFEKIKTIAGQGRVGRRTASS